MSYDELGDVLRTSPPAFTDQTYLLECMSEDRGHSPRKRQHSTSPRKTPIRSADEAAYTVPQVISGLDRGADDFALHTNGGTLASKLADCGFNPTPSHQSFAWKANPTAKARYSKGSTHCIYNTFTPLETLDYPSRRPFLSKTDLHSEEERVMFRKQIEAVRLREDRLLGMQEDLCANGAARSPKSSVDNVFIRGPGEKSAKHFANNLSRSFFRAPTVRQKTRSPKSPTHYVPNRLPPLQIPDFSKRQPVRHKQKKLTAEEDEELLQSALRKLEASRLDRLRRHGIPIERGIFAGEKSQLSATSHHVVELPSNTPMEKLTNAAEDILQMNRSLYERIIAMKLRRSLRHGAAIYSLEDSAAKGPPSVSQGIEEMSSDIQVTVHHVEDILSNTTVTVNNPSTEKCHWWTQSLSQKIEAMKLRRDRRQGAAFHRNDDAATQNSPSTSYGNHDEEVPSDTQIKGKETAEEEHQRWTHSLYQRIEAMKLKRNLCQGTAIYRDDNAPVESSPSSSHSNHDEVPLDIQVKGNETPAEEYQRWRQSLFQSIEAMKLRRNGRQGTAVYRDEDTAVECSTTPSHDEHVDVGSEIPTEGHQLWRQSLYQSIEAMKLRRNGRCGTYTYRRENTAVESSNLSSKVDHFGEMSNTTLPTSMV